ncbi:MAG: hypothetical protein WBG86_16640 [Polyangiales bacterium]
MAIDEPTGGPRTTRPGLPVDPFRLRRAILKRKKLLIGAGAVGLFLGFVIAKFVLTSGYESTAVLKFEGISAIEGMRAETELGPAADALRRQAVLRRIANDIEFGGSLTTLSALIGYNIDLMGSTMSITTPGETGEDAAGFARAVSDVFIRYHQERQAERIEAEILRIEQRIAAADAHADQARRGYNEFRETHGIADLSREQQSMLESAANLRANSELGVSEVRALEARVESLKAQLASTPETTVVSGSSPERAAYDQLRQRLATARATLSESHPQVQSLQQQVEQMRTQLRVGGSTGSGIVSANSTHQAIEGQLRTAQSNLRALQERHRGMTELADKAQVRVETFSAIEGEASSLLAEVKVSEGLMQELRRAKAALEDAMGNPSSGFVVLDPGSVPEYPLRNKAKVVVFGAVPMILFGLALVFALYKEFPGLRVQTPSEVAFWGGGPVLGTTSWPEDPNGLDELVAGLDDYAPDARGSVLIVGASPDDGPLAIELAERMNNDWVIAGAAPQAASPSTSTVAGTATPLPSPVVLTPPPPAGPYPILREPRSTALAKRPAVRSIEHVRAEPGTDRVSLEAWDGTFEGQALRRASRLADRVLVLVRSGGISALTLNTIQHRLGRNHGIGYVVLSLPEDLKSLSDRQGNVAAYWMKRA